MTNLKSLLSAFLLILFIQIGQSTNIPTDVTNFQSEIASLVKEVKLEKTDVETIYLNFIINHKGEAIVLSTNDSKNENTLKSAINYHTLKTTGYEANKVYTLPIVLKN